MKQPAPLFGLIMKPVSRLAARRALSGRLRSSRPEDGRFTRSDVTGLVERAWSLFAERGRHLPSQPTLGSRLQVRLACLTLGFFQALLERGCDRVYAIELTADVSWRIYARWGTVVRLLRGRGVTVLPKGLAAGEIVPLRFPFNPPGYLARWVPVKTGVAYDVVHCPVAEYFRAQGGAADLCLRAWCDLDFALGEQLGQTLTRERTIVLGHDRCSFRWRPTGSPVS
jgi:hypothetical protein